MDVILLLLACFGFTMTLVHGVIFDKIKLRQLWEKSSFLKELFSCSMCTGFWVGIYFSIILSLYCILPFFGVNSLIVKVAYYVLTIPFASSGVSFLLERLSILFDNINELLENDK